MSTEQTNDQQNAMHELIVAVDFSETEKDLQAAELRFKDVVHNVTTKAGMKEAKADVAELRTMRTTTEKRRLEAGRVIMSFKEKNDTVAKGIIARISALEDPIKLQIDAEETRIEAERLQAIETERLRVETIHGKIAAFRELPGKVANWPSARIEAEFNRLLATTVTKDEFEEFEDQARDALEACQMRLQGLLRDAKDREETAERARQQELELAEARERIAKMEREAEERRQADEKREREEREAAERKERERVQAIKTRIRVIEACAISDHRYGAERLSEMMLELVAHNPANGGFDFQEFAEEAANTYAMCHDSLTGALQEAVRVAKVAAEKEEADRVERQRLADEAAESERKAVAAELERAQAAREAELARQDALTLRTAAEALLQRVISAGHGSWQEAIDLVQVLSTSEGDVRPTKRTAAKPAKVARS